ncbi:argininosuccinate lyase [Psychroflexus sp. CAK1W]|uniref:argininosuccinate lyase n=1 Tax=Psychroflexus curvus TaxID=2873595 RepID=UPI001CC9F554|nr:argininosuccinate lyase [Psychroflexus curvus]MBZ9626604.1 argininosuccinate lyase [Psychroflexus curvus]
MKLWDKGIDIDQKIEQFTVGNDREIDRHIAQYDVLASQAHAKMLEKVGLITSDELKLLQEQFDIMTKQLENDAFKIDAQFEDVHSKIEFELIQNLGEVGKKIHTARSRNDQVLVALHLYYKERLQDIRSKVGQFFDTLLSLAETHKDKVLPGYTHLQVAMPSSFGLWFSAYAEQLIDDVYLLDAALKVVDQNPLGSAAGYGSSFPIDREFTTQALGFSTLKYNVVAAQMSRGKSERTVAMALGSLSNTLSRFAMDICLYSSQNFDFIGFPDQLTTGSSIMPHKKNPDVFELIRGKCNRIQALPSEMILITNNLPSGYHRDYQLLKENMISGIETMTSVLEIFDYSITQIKVKSVDVGDPKYKFMYSVDKINTLVEQGISFREAYQQIGKQINEGTYEAGSVKNHSHEGSMGNLCLDKIREKFPK